MSSGARLAFLGLFTLLWVRVQHFENINMISLKGLFLPGPTCSLLLCQGFCATHLVRTTLHSLMISPGLAFEEREYFLFPLGISRSLEGCRNSGVRDLGSRSSLSLTKHAALDATYSASSFRALFSHVVGKKDQTRALLKYTPVQTTGLCFPGN